MKKPKDFNFANLKNFEPNSLADLVNSYEQIAKHFNNIVEIFSNVSQEIFDTKDKDFLKEYNALVDYFKHEREKYEKLAVFGLVLLKQTTHKKLN